MDTVNFTKDNLYLPNKRQDYKQGSFLENTFFLIK